MAALVGAAWQRSGLEHRSRLGAAGSLVHKGDRLVLDAIGSSTVDADPARKAFGFAPGHWNVSVTETVA
jgi:hypothetical protein